MTPTATSFSWWRVLLVAVIAVVLVTSVMAANEAQHARAEACAAQRTMMEGLAMLAKEVYAPYPVPPTGQQFIQEWFARNAEQKRGLAAFTRQYRLPRCA